MRLDIGRWFDMLEAAAKVHIPGEAILLRIGCAGKGATITARRFGAVCVSVDSAIALRASQIVWISFEGRILALICPCQLRSAGGMD